MSSHLPTRERRRWLSTEPPPFAASTRPGRFRDVRPCWTAPDGGQTGAVLSAATPPLPEALRYVPDRLHSEFGDDVAHEHIHQAVAQAYQELAADARVTSFLPILTEKVARDRLRAHHRSS